MLHIPMKFVVFIDEKIVNPLNHCGLMMPYGDIELGQ